MTDELRVAAVAGRDLQRSWQTPFEQGNGDQTTTWSACIAFYERLALEFPFLLRFSEIGRSDAGRPIHLGIVSADGQFDADRIRAEGRTVVFNNNGIHPGEPEGIDACMALVRDLCVRPELQAALGSVVLVFIPIYNVDGAVNRQNQSRVNQNGPESFGFRGTANHLDLNRDFIKAFSRNTRVFCEAFTHWDPELFVDTHTSNGADYQHVLTLIATQPDKLGGSLGDYERRELLPDLYRRMAERGFDMCPYINLVGQAPEQGIADFLDTPRFSTGYAALQQCIGFMPETHMLKEFSQRYQSLRSFIECVLEIAAEQGTAIRALRARDREAISSAASLPLAWQSDPQSSSRFRFKGYRAEYLPSRLGPYTRQRYDRSQPYEEEIDVYDRCVPRDFVSRPAGYLIPQAWSVVVERLRGNRVDVRTVSDVRTLDVERWRVTHFEKSALPFEGHHLHTNLALRAEAARVQAQPGDFIVSMKQRGARYVFETLEPLGVDSFFRWGFFDSILDKKEHYSDYLFEDEAERLLAAEPDLSAKFRAWQTAHPDLAARAEAVLDFIFHHCERYAEPNWRLYPIFRILTEAAMEFA